MKAILTPLFAILFFQNSSFSQIEEHNHYHNKMTESELIAAKLKSVQLIFDADSIAGFNELAAKQQASSTGAPEWEQTIRIAHMKRNYLDTKYNLVSSENLNNTPGVRAPCSNVDFETGNASSWILQEGMNTNSLTQAGCCPTTTTRFAVVGAGVDPVVAALPRVPPGGGNFALQIGDLSTTGGYSVRAKQTFAVTSANSLFIYKFAVVLEDGTHACADQPFFNITFTDATGNPIPCGAYQVTQIGAGCTTGGDPGFIATTGGPFGFQYFYKPWTTRAFDLTPYIGQNVTVQFTTGDCTLGAHAGWGYVDCACQPLSLSLNGVDIPVGQTNIIRCNAIGSEKLCAVAGFNSYTWTGPGVTGQTTQCINVTQAGSYSVALTVVAGSGNCANPVLYSNFIVVPKPIANFNFTPPPPCQTPIVVTFTNASSLNGGPAITNWYWDFDNNGTVDNTTSSPTFTYNAAGTYTVELKVNNGGCFDSITKVITITPGNVKADFVFNSGCLNTPSNFTSTATPSTGLTSQIWYWGDGTPNGTGPTLAHSYTAPGTYSVSHVVSIGTCKDSITKVVTVSPIPIINFTSNTVCLGTPTNFTNTSSVAPPDNIITWAWDFDNNGSTDNTTQNPSNTFISAGTFSVELKGITNNGCRDSVTLPITIISLPVAQFTAIDACMNTNVVLNNTSTPGSTTYDWYFGPDATPLTSTVSAPASLMYSTSGVKTITLNINANTTCSATVTQTVTIFPDPVASFSVPSVCKNVASVYTDLSTPTGSITAWKWDFTNDGTVDDQTATPSHVFPVAGTYTTSLIVTSSNGCFDTIKLPLNVWGRAIPDFLASSACDKTPITFTAVALPNSATVATWNWDFNNSITTFEGTGINSTFIFPAAGSHTVALVAITSNGCVDTVFKPIYVNQIPVPLFTVDDPDGCPVHCVTFSDSSTPLNGLDKITQWIWSLGDGSKNVINTTNANVKHCYTNTSHNQLAVFDIKLTVTTIAGCIDSINKKSFITVFPTPIAKYEVAPNPVSVIEPSVYFNNQSSDYTKWWWTFGDGPIKSDSINKNPKHTYPEINETMVYNTKLLVMNQYGCIAEAEEPVQIDPMWTFYIPNCFTPNNEDGVNDFFTGFGIGITYFEMWIYDRWGENIFYTNDMTKGWNGTVKGYSEESKQDVYTWKVKIKNIFGKNHSYVGHVTILK